MQLSEKDVKAVARSRAVSGKQFNRRYWFWILCIMATSIGGIALIEWTDIRWLTAAYVVLFGFMVVIPIYLFICLMHREEKKLLEEWRRENGH